MKDLKLPLRELSEIVSNSSDSLAGLSGARILVAGGTGFIGRWLVSSLLEASDEFKLEIDLLVRNRAKATAHFSKYGNGRIRIHGIHQANQISGVTHIIHSATPSSPSTGGNDMKGVYKSSIDIGNLLFDVAKRSNTPTFMHLSSGAVYGAKATKNLPISENLHISENITDLYMKSKIDLEVQIVNATKAGWVKGANPRLFSFAGPGIAIDAHFAVGNFMEQALQGKRVVVKGHPDTSRSYLYPVDMTTWLLASLANPSLEGTHIGSNFGYSMSEIAGIVASEFNVEAVISGNLEIQPNFYVPDTKSTQKRLNVSQSIFLPEAISRWRKWLEI